MSTSEEKGYSATNSDTRTREKKRNAKIDSDRNDVEPMFALRPPQSHRDDRTCTDIDDDDNHIIKDEADNPGQSYIRQRNAIYSKRKYYKKKRYIEQLKASRYQLETCNNKLRESNAQLESLVQRANDDVAIKEQTTAMVMAQDQKQKQLQALLLLRQRQHHVDATLANTAGTTGRHPQLSNIGSMIPQDHSMDQIPSMDAASFTPLPNLTTSGVNTAITRQALQQGLATQNNTLSTESSLLSSQLLSSILRNQNLQTAATSSLSALNNVLSRVPMINTRSPDTPSLLNTWLRQSELEMSAAIPVMSSHNSIAASIQDLLYANNNNNTGNSNLAVIEALKALQDQQMFRNSTHYGNSSLSIIETLRSLQDQQIFRDNTGNGNSSLSIIDALKSLQEQQASRSTNDAIGNSSRSILEALKSLQDQQTIRNIVVANEHTQRQQQQQQQQQRQRQQNEAATAATGIANATLTAHQQLLQNQSLDQNALLQYYLSLSGRRK